MVPVLLLGSRFLHTRSLEQLPPPHWIIHHRFIGSLFLLLDGEHRIFSNLRCRISRSVGILHSHERIFSSRFLQLLIFSAFDQIIDASLSQEVAFHLFSSARLSV